MVRAIAFFVACLLSGITRVSAQDTAGNGKALNIPSEKYGLSIGNSHEFNGIRINFADRDVKKINGLNITFWLRKAQNQEAIVNGVNVGVIPTAGAMGPVNIGLLGIGSSPGNSNGITIAGFVIGGGGNINGLSLSGIMTMADGRSSEISGVAIAGIGLGAHKAINGLAIAGLGLGSDENINGLAASLFYIKGGVKVNGAAFTAGYMETGILNGLATACYAKTNKTNGISLAVYNRSNELHGIQLGLLNYAGNNRKGLRMLPLINLHFGKR